MHPYLLSREAHSTGLCDVSSADYSRTFLPRTRTAPATHAREPVDMAEGEGFEPPVPCGTTVFKTVTFGRSVNLPLPNKIQRV